MNTATGEPTERLYILDVSLRATFDFLARMCGESAAREICKHRAPRWLTVASSEGGNISLQRHTTAAGALKVLRAALAATGARAAGTGHLSVDWIVGPVLDKTFK